MPAEAENTKLLWIMLKQVDQKLIDWAVVAQELGINTSAANMRFFRLKKKMESAGEAQESKTPASLKRKDLVDHADEPAKKKKKDTGAKGGKNIGKAQEEDAETRLSGKIEATF
ncbi:MAG: hypothetical protein Q9220_002949 [cf. Caloplaca sp. 1 TL-2023]